MLSTENSYPLLLIPSSINMLIKEKTELYQKLIIEQQLGKKPATPLCPAQPLKPIKPSITEENNTSRYFISINLIILFVTVGFVAIYLVLNKFSESSIFASCLFWLPVFIFFLIKYSKDLSEEKKLKDKKISIKNEYDNQLKIFEASNRKYQIDYGKFIQDSKDHRTNIKKYDWLVDNLNFDEFSRKSDLYEFINLQIAGFSALIKGPIPNIKTFTIGISEKYFLKHLKQYFPEFTIIRNHILDGFSYEPDFIIILKNGLLLDIEIDEPYTGNSKECIHFYDYDKKEFSDQRRNNFFIANNWIVLRFAEEQIIRTPQSCCKFIAKVTNNFFQDYDMDVFEGVEDLREVRIWSKKEANEMAYFDSRKHYITDDFVNHQSKT